MFTPIIIPNKHTEKVKLNEKRPGKKFSVVSVVYENKTKRLFTLLG